MRKEAVAVGIVFLLLGSLILYSVLQDEKTEDDSDQIGEDDEQLLEDWGVYYVQSGDDLPACGSPTIGRLYYVASHSGFETCTTNGWEFVNLVGPEGAPGTNGSVGPAGPAGPAGLNGSNGVDSSASTSTLLTAISEPNGAFGCLEGGRTISYGLDNGDQLQNVYAANNTIFSDVDEELDIPYGEGEYGLNTSINWTGSGLIYEIEVYVDINHSYSGDIAMDLVAPTGQRVTLWDEHGGSNDWVSIWLPQEWRGMQLLDLKGVEIEGEWTLLVGDEFIEDDGTLVSWGIRHTNNFSTTPSYAANGVLEKDEVDAAMTHCNRFEVEIVTNHVIPGWEFDPTDTIVVDSVLYFQSPDLDSSWGYYLMAYSPTNKSVWVITEGLTGEPLAAHGGSIYFEKRVIGAVSEYQLWEYSIGDGTTTMVHDELDGYTDLKVAYWAPTPHPILLFNSYLEYTGWGSNTELFAYQLNNMSAWQITDLCHNCTANIDEIEVMGTRFYFTADDGESWGETDRVWGKELYAHEITNNSTWVVEDINPGWNNSSPRHLTVMDSRLYFQAYSPTHGVELWAHETTNDSTWMVTDFYQGVNSGINYDEMAVVGSRIYLSCAKEFVSDGLCVHETTNNTTWMIHEFYSDLDDMFSFGSSVFFSTRGFDGGELRSGVWMYNENTGGLAMVDAVTATRNWVIVGDDLYFTAYGGSEIGRELYVASIELFSHFE